jgi:hypothetical protein
VKGTTQRRKNLAGGSGAWHVSPLNPRPNNRLACAFGVSTSLIIAYFFFFLSFSLSFIIPSLFLFCFCSTPGCFLGRFYNIAVLPTFNHAVV